MSHPGSTGDRDSLSISEAADFLGVSTTALRKRAQRGTIDSFKDENGEWRISRAEVDRLARSRRMMPRRSGYGAGMLDDGNDFDDLNAELDDMQDDLDELVGDYEDLEASLREELKRQIERLEQQIDGLMKEQQSERTRHAEELKRRDGLLHQAQTQITGMMGQLARPPAPAAVPPVAPPAATASAPVDSTLSADADQGEAAAPEPGTDASAPAAPAADAAETAEQPAAEDDETRTAPEREPEREPESEPERIETGRAAGPLLVRADLEAADDAETDNADVTAPRDNDLADDSERETDSDDGSGSALLQRLHSQTAHAGPLASAALADPDLAAKHDGEFMFIEDENPDAGRGFRANGEASDSMTVDGLGLVDEQDEANAHVAVAVVDSAADAIADDADFGSDSAPDSAPDDAPDDALDDTPDDAGAPPAVQPISLLRSMRGEVPATDARFELDNTEPDDSEAGARDSNDRPALTITEEERSSLGHADAGKKSAEPASSADSRPLTTRERAEYGVQLSSVQSDEPATWLAWRNIWPLLAGLAIVLAAVVAIIARRNNLSSLDQINLWFAQFQALFGA